MYTKRGVKGCGLTGGRKMKLDALEWTLLFDYYGDLLTERQQTCFDLYYNQDLSLGEIAEEAGISRQGVYDTIARAKASLKTMEDKTGCMRRDSACRQAMEKIQAAASLLAQAKEKSICALAEEILQAVEEAKEQA